jgi:hypothetical protein
MKTLTATLIFFCACCFGHAQRLDTNRVLYITTSLNLVSISNAVMIASGLRVGMSASDVQKYMHEHGMTNEWVGQTNMFSVSLDRGRTLACPYPLAGGASLMLDMHCTKAPPSGLFGWSDPVIDGARIQSLGADVISITLTNAR